MHCAHINLKIVRPVTSGLWTPSASSFCIDPSVVRLITRTVNCACRHFGIWYLFGVRYLYSFTCYKEGKANLSDNLNHLRQVQRTSLQKKKKKKHFSILSETSVKIYSLHKLRRNFFTNHLQVSFLFINFKRKLDVYRRNLARGSISPVRSC